MTDVKGVAPGFLLLPAREYEWALQRRIEIKIPLKGKISELLTKTDLDAGVKLSGEDSFSIFEDGILQLWEIIRVLFAKAEYPALATDECINIVALEFLDEEVILYGEVIRRLE